MGAATDADPGLCGPGATVSPDAGRHADWATIPNVVTVARLVLFAPLVVGMIASRQHWIAAAVLLVVYASTDWVDGFLARRLGQVSRLGALLDPLADRAGEMAIYAAMLAVGVLPWWAVAVIVTVDLGLFAIVALRAEAVHDLSVTWLGKLRTVILMAALPLLTLGAADLAVASTIGAIGLVLLVIGSVLHVAAGVLYAVLMLRTPRAD